MDQSRLGSPSMVHLSGNFQEGGRLSGKNIAWPIMPADSAERRFRRHAPASV